MGLTIHYTLTLPAKTTVPEIRQKLGTFRQACLDLPFQEVSEMLEFKGDECNPDRLERGHPLRWFLCQADSHVYFQIASNGKPMAVQQLQDGCYSRTVLPTHVIGFSTYPGNGCEQANVGLSRFPRTVIVGNKQSGKNHRLPIEDGGSWKWHSFCKTQYANERGLENFLRCHLSVVAMLDAAKRIGFDVQVNDEGHYWERRNVADLIKQIGEWDKFIAGFAGALKDAAESAGMAIQSPIMDRRDFERLEAAGQAQLPPGFSKAVRSLVQTTALVKTEKLEN
jgi:hypothetical protein